MFITFEGIDGSGKSTQAKLLYARLREAGYDVLLTREPGGTPIGDQIRTILLDNMDNTAMHPSAELLLFCASRAQLVNERIRPHLASGGIVLCDRYADSTLAYQGYGHGLDIKTLQQLLNFATGGLKPDITVYLELDPAIGLGRRRKARLFESEDWNRLDDMELAFHRRVYAGYQALIAQSPRRWLPLDAQGDEASVQEALWDALVKKLKKYQK